MRVTTEVPEEEPLIIMSRIYDAPRSRVWDAMTQARHVARWWGGAGVTNPVCEMDVRPGGHWRHVMRFPDGHELHLQFVFVEVDEPGRLVWRSAAHEHADGPPDSTTTVTLEDMGERTGWKMVSRFSSLDDRRAALAVSFTHPIERSSDSLVEYLRTNSAD